MRSFASCFLALPLAVGLGGSAKIHAETFSEKLHNGETVTSAPGDPAMAEAVRKARTTLPAFLEASRHPRPGTEGYAVKVGIGPFGDQEFVWLTPFKVTGDEVAGTLDNALQKGGGLNRGDTVKLPLSAVTDWMYFDHGAMQGNYSACALLTHESAADRAEVERQYGMSCADK